MDRCSLAQYAGENKIRTTNEGDGINSWSLAMDVLTDQIKMIFTITKSINALQNTDTAKAFCL